MNNGTELCYSKIIAQTPTFAWAIFPDLRPDMACARGTYKGAGGPLLLIFLIP